MFILVVTEMLKRLSTLPFLVFLYTVSGTGFDSRSQYSMEMSHIKMRTELIKGELSILTNDGYEVCVEV